MCLALRPATMETKRFLEDLMPEEEILPREKIVANTSHIKPFSYKQKDMIVSLFDDLSIAHERLGCAASTMSSLCKVMDPNQLLLIMKCSIYPLIQLLASPGLFDPLIHTEKKELPDNKQERIRKTMIQEWMGKS